jgi:hypothetical protein
MVTKTEEVKAVDERDVEDKPNIRFWLSQHEAAKKAGKEYLDHTDEAWREYLGAYQGPPMLKQPVKQEVDARYPAFWSSIRTMQPAIYSRTPITEAQKMFDSLNDNVARLSSLGIERLSKYLIHDCPFDRVQYATRDDFLLSGRCTNRICFDSQISSQPKKIYYVETQQPVGPAPTESQGQEGQGSPQQIGAEQGQPQTQAAPPMEQAPQFQIVWVNDRGETLDDPSNLLQDESGFYLESADEVDENVDDCCVSLHPVSYRDIRHTPNARHWEEIDWISFRTLMTKAEVSDRFGEEWVNKLPFSQKASSREAVETDKSDLIPTPYVEVWETWNKSRKEIMWHVEDYAQDFLDVQPDIYELAEFWPCPPFMLGTQGPDSLFTVPDYVQLKPPITQMHAMAKRYKTAVRAVATRAIADASLADQITDANNQGHAGILFVKDFQGSIVGKGGLENLIHFLPTEQYANEMATLQEAISNYNQAFYELWGIPDIIRGVSDPNETAAAQQLKGKYNSLRFSQIQREFQRLVRDDIELMCDLALKKFPEEQLIDIIGVRFWENEDQQLWPQVYQLLKDDEERKIRIDIQTDSTISMNADAEIERANYLAKTLTDGIASIAAVEQQDLAYQILAMDALLMVVEKLPNGKEFSQSLRKIKEQKIEEMQNPAPPPPDPKIQVEQMKQEGKLQELQMKGGLEQQKAQTDFQLKGAELQGQQQIELVQAQSDIAVTMAKIKAEIQRSSIESAAKMQLEQTLAGLDAQLKILEAGLKMREHKVEMAHEVHAAGVDASLKKFETEQNVKLMNKKAEQAYSSSPPT